MSQIWFEIPGQPQGKGRPRVGKRGQHARMFTPAKTVSYEGMVAMAAHQAMAGRPLVEGPVFVEMALACQIPSSWSGKKQRQALAGQIRPTTKPDVDNVVKAVFDGCNGVLWKDDVQVVTLSLSKFYSDSPAVSVRVMPAEPAQMET